MGCCCWPPARSGVSWRGCGSSTPTARRRSCRAMARARRSCICAAAGGPSWTSSAIETAAGEIRPTITARHLPGGHGRARPDLARTFRRSEMGAASWSPMGAPCVSSTSRSATRQCAIQVEDVTRCSALDLPAIGPAIEGGELFPQPHERVVVHGAPRTRRIRRFARESSSAGWARRSPRGRGRRARRSPTGSRGVPPQGARRVTVVLDGGELEVEIGEELRVHLTGWARRCSRVR